MNTTSAYCGLSCSDCPAFIATRNNNDQERSKVAHQWSKWFKMNLEAKDINCDGCKVTGKRLFGHCNNCMVRKCAQNKNIEICAYCPDYSCEKLDSLLSSFPTSFARENLEKLKK